MGRGAIDLSTAIPTGLALAKEPAFQPNFKILVDLREMNVNNPGPTTRELRTLAQEFKQLSALYQNKVAVVVSGTFAFGLARMTSTLAEFAGFHFSAFNNMAYAIDWIIKD